MEKQNLVDAQAQTRAYSYGLAQLLGLSQNQRVVAAENLRAEDAETPSEQQSVEDAFNSRPDLISAEAEYSAAVYDRKASVAEEFPEVHFDGFWAESGRSPGGALPIYTYQAEIRLPIFTGGRITEEIRRAQLRQTRTDELVNDRRDVITQEVRTALSFLQAAREDLQLSTEAVKLSLREVSLFCKQRDGIPPKQFTYKSV